MYDVDNISDLVNRYFSSTPWLIVFLVSVIYLFFRLNVRRKKAMIAGTIAFCIIINAFVIKIFTAFGENSTFYRNLWAIPSIAIIGIAMVDVIRIIPKWFLKIPMLFAFGILLWFINQQEYIRCRTQSISMDAKMVQKEVIELGDELEGLWKKSEKNTLFVVCPKAYMLNYGDMPTELGLYSGFLSIYDSSILNSSEHNGEAELMGENPDLEYIISTCCANGMDYVIVTENNVNELSEIKPVFKSKAFMIYECKGYGGFEQDINSAGQVVWKSWYDEKGQPTENEKGYSRVEYEINGRKTIEKYKDIDGNLCEVKGEGYARVERLYTMAGTLAEARYYNAEGELTPLIEYGYCIVRYSLQGQELTVTFFDDKEELTDCMPWNPHAVEIYRSDKRGNCILEITLDKDGNPSHSYTGYNEISREYDNNNRKIRERYFYGGVPVNRIDTRYAEVAWEYDEAGNEIVHYFDLNGQEIEPEGN